VASVACFALAHADAYLPYVVLIAAFMAADGVLTVVLRTLRSRLIPAEVFGSTLSLTVLILLLPYPLAGILVATTPPAALPHVITACAILQAFGLALAFTVIKGSPTRGGGRHRKLSQ
jgi:hypothetical protein